MKKTLAVDAIKLLKEDHKVVRKLLGELDKATLASRRRELLKKIEKEIKIHTEIEEKIFYPAFKEAAKTKKDNKIFFEAHDEHDLADLVLVAAKETPAETDQFAAKAKVLKDLIEHHAEEEETEMFPRARKLFKKEEMQALGDQLQKEKLALKKKY